MISNRLATLMAARKVKATRLASDTGIARSTISSLTNDSSKMIQFETINTICQYLNITPKDFFIYSPYDVTFDIEPTKVLSSTSVEDVSLKWSESVKAFNADIFAKFTSRGETVTVAEMTASLQKPAIYYGAEDFALNEGNKIFIDIHSSVEPYFENIWNKFFTDAEFLASVNSEFDAQIESVIKNALNEASNSTSFSNWNITTSGLPTLPF